MRFIKSLLRKTDIQTSHHSNHTIPPIENLIIQLSNHHTIIILKSFELRNICLRRPSARGPRALHALPPRSVHPPAFHFLTHAFVSFLARAPLDEPRDLLFAFVLQIDRLLPSREIRAFQMRISPSLLVDGEDAFDDIIR